MSEDIMVGCFYGGQNDILGLYLVWLNGLAWIWCYWCQVF